MIRLVYEPRSSALGSTRSGSLSYVQIDSRTEYIAVWRSPATNKPDDVISLHNAEDLITAKDSALLADFTEQEVNAFFHLVKSVVSAAEHAKIECLVP